jgi:hypothetical protein
MDFSGISLHGVKVGTDLDEVGYRFNRAFDLWVIEHSGLARQSGLFVPTEPAEHSTWNYYEKWGWNRELFLAVLAEGVDAGFIFLEGEPLPGFIEGMQLMHAAGASQHIVTDRSIGEPGMAASLTVKWLHLYGVPLTSLTITKEKAIMVAGLTTFLDDAPHNVRAIRKDTTVDCMALTRPYNRRMVVPRVESFMDYTRYVFETYGKPASRRRR